MKALRGLDEKPPVYLSFMAPGRVINRTHSLRWKQQTRNMNMQSTDYTPLSTEETNLLYL